MNSMNPMDIFDAEMKDNGETLFSSEMTENVDVLKIRCTSNLNLIAPPFETVCSFSRCDCVVVPKYHI